MPDAPGPPTLDVVRVDAGGGGGGDGYQDSDSSLSLLPLFGDTRDHEDDGPTAQEMNITRDLEFAEQQKIGPLLTALREQQDQGMISNKETYSVEHLRRLYQFAPERPYSKPRANKLCSKVHPKPCYECKSCHFCRQRTTEMKTVCSVCDGVNNYYGGPARGIWCGSCLWLRVGENIDEVRDMKDWICPCCRDICNCSGVNCMRLKRGWFPTNQLSHEAKDQGYKSVAHYLILTHLSEHASVESIGVGLVKARRARRVGHGVRQVVEDEGTDEDSGSLRSMEGSMRRRSPPKQQNESRRQRQLPLEYRGTKTRREALELASKPRLEREITIIHRDLGATAMSASLLSRIVGQSQNMEVQTKFLCLLDEDDCDDEEEDVRDGENDAAVRDGATATAPRWTGLGVPPAAFPASVGSLTTSTLAAGTKTAHTRSADVAHANVLYADGGAPQTVTTVSISRLARKRADTHAYRDLLPPKRPAMRRKKRRKGTGASRGDGGQSHGARRGQTDDVVPTLSVISDSQDDSDECWVDDGDDRADGDVYPADAVQDRGAPIPLPTSMADNQPIIQSTSGLPDHEISLDEFVWNGLCLRANSVVDAVKTFYKFHPDVEHSSPFLDPDQDRYVLLFRDCVRRWLPFYDAQRETRALALAMPAACPLRALHPHNPLRMCPSLQEVVRGRV